jgi:uncharacterized protein YcsI (UPF0317 family)
MFISNIECVPASRFYGPMVVTMCPRVELVITHEPEQMFLTDLRCIDALNLPHLCDLRVPS